MIGVKYLLDTNFVLGLLKSAPDIVEMATLCEVVVGDARLERILMNPPGHPRSCGVACNTT